MGNDEVWGSRKGTSWPFGSRSTQYLQGIFADYNVHPLYYSLASLGSYKNRGSFLTATLCPLSVCKTVLLARGSALASDHPDSPIASCNVSEAACLERKSGKCKMCSSPRGEGPQHEEGTCPGDNEAELQYRAKQGAFCKVCKDCIADTWHLVNECKGAEVVAARAAALASAGPALRALFSGIKKAADLHGTSTNGFDVTSETIGNYIHYIEEFVGADPSKWTSGIGRFLAFRCLTAWPFPRGPTDDHRPTSEFGVECAKAMAVIFEATRLPPTLLKHLLSDWVSVAARGINQLMKAWALDCGRAPGGWVFVMKGTDLVAGCGVGLPLVALPIPIQGNVQSLSVRTVDSHSVASEASSLDRFAHAV